MNYDPDHLDAMFNHAIDLDETDRAAYLDEVCGGNQGLRKKVELLIRSEENRQGFLHDPTMETPKEDAADALIGVTIGPYKILQALGEGGYGAVYLAEQRKPVKRRIALKVIKLGMDTKQVIARFEAERQALALMEHPNIAKVFDAGATESGRPYFVMELVRGLPITEYCDQVKLPMEKRLNLFVQVCRAVQHAHQKGVIHRDIKPNNILVTLHDGVPVPKVIDFGIAKATNIQLTDKTLFTDFRQFVGTPAYTSPEQVEMSGLDVDTRSDLYSLGVLLYELLTGTTPVPVETLKQAAYAEIQRTILDTDPPTPSTRISTLANARQVEVAAARAESPNKLRQLLLGELDWILMKALEKDRERRYETANAFAQDVQHFLANEPITAGAPGVLYRLRKHARRHKAAAVVAVALLLGGIVSTWQAIRATVASDEARAQAIRAETGELEARQNLYIADMNVAQDALKSGNMERAITILESHIPKANQKDLRHWEWRYLWGQTHRELFTLIADDDPNDEEKPDGIVDLTLSQDNKILVSSAADGRVRVWDMETKSELFQFRIPAGEWAWADISPNGRLIVAGGQYWSDKRVNEGVHPLPSAQKSGEARNRVVVWNIAKREEIHRFSIAPSTSACNPQFISDTVICVGGSEGNVWFCDLSSGEVEAFKKHKNPVEGVAVAGNHLVTSSEDGLNIWDAAARNVLSTIDFAEPTRAGMLVDIAPDGRWIASHCSWEPKVTIYDRHSLEVETNIPVDYDVFGTRFNHDGSLLATSEANGTIRLFDTRDWKERTRYHIRSHQLNHSAFSDDGKWIVSGGDNGVITGWPGTPPARGILQSKARMISSVQYSPDGRFIAVGCGDGRVELWAADGETRLLEIPPQSRDEKMFRFDFFAFSPDSRHIAVAHQASDEGDGSSADLWDLVKMERIVSWPHPKRVGTIAYSPDGRMLATGCYDEEGIRIWDVASGNIIRRMEQEKSIQCLTFSRYSKLLVSKGWDNDGVLVWDIETGQRVATLDEHIESIGDTSAVLFSPDGKLLATAGYDCQVILWDTESWQSVQRLLGHGWMVIDLAFSPDGTRLASSSPENWCRLWDVASGHELARFPGLALDYSPDGNALTVAGDYIAPGAMNNSSPRESTIRIRRASTFEDIAGGQ